jgi:hypothetical protein
MAHNFLLEKKKPNRTVGSSYTRRRLCCGRDSNRFLLCGSVSRRCKIIHGRWRLNMERYIEPMIHSLWSAHPLSWFMHATTAAPAPCCAWIQPRKVHRHSDPDSSTDQVESIEMGEPTLSSGGMCKPQRVRVSTRTVIYYVMLILPQRVCVTSGKLKNTFLHFFTLFCKKS